ncbi:quinon protein alcohol dehydrogenase-like superfamily [Lanmaoa asiatica]|nr:quinon protein alcohol dehydrogenase-like superfamily [Lanmaoa asiatica]
MSNVTRHQSDNGGPQLHLIISVHDDFIRTFAYLPDGRVVTGSGDGTVRVWNLDKREQEGTLLKHENEIRSLTVTQDGTKIISSHDYGEIKVWDIESQELVNKWTRPLTRYTEVAMSPDGRLIAVGDGTTGTYTVMDNRVITVCDWTFICAVEGRWVNYPIEVGKKVHSVCFSPDGRKLACGTSYDIHVYDIESGVLLLAPLTGHRDWVRCVLWSLDGATLFSASFDKTIRCWNSDTGNQIGHPWTSHIGPVFSLSLSPDGSIIASASLDHTVRFWDATSGNQVGKHLQHLGGVMMVSFSPSGEFVASAGCHGEIHFWRMPRLDSIHDQTNQTVSDLPLVHLTGAEQVWSFDPSLYVSAPASRPTVLPSALPHSYSTPLPTVDTQRQKANLGPFPPPPDLTRHIVRIKDQYSAGGSFGDVYKCRYLDGPVSKEVWVAVKALRFSFTMGGVSKKSVKIAFQMLRRELGIWKRLNHINIVPFLGIAYGFGMDGSMALVSLWMPNESLHSFLAKYDDKLGVQHRLQLLLDIANGLQYRGLMLSFPKLKEMMLYTARLTDFGYASLVGNIPEALGYLQRSTARPGTLRWIAPEQIDPEASIAQTTKSDVYSFGCACSPGRSIAHQSSRVRFFDLVAGFVWQTTIGRNSRKTQPSF